MGFTKEEVEDMQRKVSGNFKKSKPVKQVKENKYARPRDVKGKMNKGEEKFSREFLEPRKQSGVSSDWKYEPFGLRLAVKCFYHPDFLEVVDHVIIYEYKGHWEDDARVKMKVAAKEFPFFEFIGVTWDRKTQQFVFEKF